MFDWSETRPDMHEDRVAWEKSWQDDFDRIYRTYARLLEAGCSVLSVMSPQVINAVNTDGTLLLLDVTETSICNLQMQLTRDAAAEFAHNDFERRWLALSTARREQVVLEGIYRTFREPSMEWRRQWAPDSTLKNLTARNGEEYLRILKCLMPDSIGQPGREPIHVPHPLLDRFFTPSPPEQEHPGCRIMLRTFRNDRACALTGVIWHIFLTFVRHYITSTSKRAELKQTQCGRESAMGVAKCPRSSNKLGDGNVAGSRCLTATLTGCRRHPVADCRRRAAPAGGGRRQSTVPSNGATGRRRPSLAVAYCRCLLLMVRRGADICRWTLKTADWTARMSKQTKRRLKPQDGWDT